MKKSILQTISILTAILFLITVNFSYSQWTLAGSLSNLGTTNPAPAVSVVDQNTVWIVGGELTPTIYRTTNGGTNWLTVPTTGIAINLYCVWAFDANTAFVGDGGNPGGTTGGDAKFYKTTDAGLTWTTVGNTGGNAGFFNGIVFSKTVPSFGIAQSDPPTGAGNPYYVSVSTNGGNSWTVTNPPGFTGSASAVNSIVVIDNMFYGFGSNTAPPALICTTDGGTTWNKRNTTITGNFTSGVAFKDDKLTGLVSSSTSLPNIARTTDAGATWTIIGVGTGFTGYSTIKWINGTNTCYISAATGAAGVVKKSTDGGLTWTTMTTSGLTGIAHMEFRRVGTSVYGYAVTSNGLVLKLTDVVTDIAPVNSSVPSDFSLDQNYPNPFNPSTTINFSIPTSSEVSLKVYDALGKEVASLVNEFKNAGNYSVNFDAGSNLTSGVYYYTISAGNFTSTKKLMLVK